MEILTPVKYNKFALFRELKIGYSVAFSLEGVTTFPLGVLAGLPKACID